MAAPAPAQPFVWPSIQDVFDGIGKAVALPTAALMDAAAYLGGKPQAATNVAALGLKLPTLPSLATPAAASVTPAAPSSPAQALALPVAMPFAPLTTSAPPGTYMPGAGHAAGVLIVNPPSPPLSSTDALAVMIGKSESLPPNLAQAKAQATMTPTTTQAPAAPLSSMDIQRAAGTQATAAQATLAKQANDARLAQAQSLRTQALQELAASQAATDPTQKLQHADNAVSLSAQADALAHPTRMPTYGLQAVPSFVDVNGNTFGQLF